jgi:cell pole-organizing protein PopZ
MDQLTQIIKKQDERIAQGTNNAYHAFNASQATTAALEKVEAGIKALPNLLTRLREDGEGRASSLKGIQDQMETINQMVQALEERMPPQDHQKQERPSSAASMRSEVTFHPQRHSTRNRTLGEEEESDREASDKIPKGAKAKKPEAFKGKRGQEAENFLMKMEVYFSDYGQAFDDRRKITTTLTNMEEGEATKWAKPLLRRQIDQTAHESLRTWGTFKNAFLLAFGDPIKKDRAIREIGRLTQTGSAQHYASQFRILMDDLNWDEKALIDKFKGGLKTNVQQELLRATFLIDTENVPLEKWIELAIKTDDVLFANRSMGNPHQSREHSGRAANTAQATNTTQTRPGWVPIAEINRRKKEGLCLKCAKKGHLRKDCKQKAYTPAVEQGKAAEIDKEDDSKSTSESEN